MQKGVIKEKQQTRKPRDTNLVDKRWRRQHWRTKVSSLLIKGPLRSFRHSFGEGHLNFVTPKRKGNEDLDYLYINQCSIHKAITEYMVGKDQERAKWRRDKNRIQNSWSHVNCGLSNQLTDWVLYLITRVCPIFLLNAFVPASLCCVTHYSMCYQE